MERDNQYTWDNWENLIYDILEEETGEIIWSDFGVYAAKNAVKEYNRLRPTTDKLLIIVNEQTGELLSPTATCDCCGEIGATPNHNDIGPDHICDPCRYHHITRP
jgi:hypothetical protein